VTQHMHTENGKSQHPVRTVSRHAGLMQPQT